MACSTACSSMAGIRRWSRWKYRIQAGGSWRRGVCSPVSRCRGFCVVGIDVSLSQQPISPILMVPGGLLLPGNAVSPIPQPPSKTDLLFGAPSGHIDRDAQPSISDTIVSAPVRMQHLKLHISRDALLFLDSPPPTPAYFSPRPSYHLF